MDNNEIFFTIRSELIHLSPLQKGGYHVAGRYSFHHYIQDEPLWISGIFPSEHDYEFYVGSWQYLFRFALNDHD